MSDVQSVLSRLRRRRAPDCHGLRAEHLRVSALHPVLLTLLSLYVSSPMLPSPCGEGLITPVHKRGDRSLPGNYRLITVQPIVTKLFSTYLLSRLLSRLPPETCLHPAQNAFLPQHHSLDHAFTLYTLVLASRAARRPLYAVFLDLRQAYDSVSHPLLFAQLRAFGLTQEEVALVTKLYTSASARVSTPAGASAAFPIRHGLLQGDPCSPVLFDYHIDALARSVAAEDTDAPRLLSLLIPLLLHADDIVLLSHSPAGAQRALTVALVALDRLGHTVQPLKSAVLIFSSSPRSRGPPPSLSLTIADTPIPVVSEFWYLVLLIFCVTSLRHSP